MLFIVASYGCVYSIRAPVLPSADGRHEPRGIVFARGRSVLEVFFFFFAEGNKLWKLITNISMLYSTKNKSFLMGTTPQKLHRLYSTAYNEAVVKISAVLALWRVSDCPRKMILGVRTQALTSFNVHHFKSHCTGREPLSQ